MNFRGEPTGEGEVVNADLGGPADAQVFEVRAASENVDRGTENRESQAFLESVMPDYNQAMINIAELLYDLGNVDQHAGAGMIRQKQIVDTITISLSKMMVGLSLDDDEDIWGSGTEGVKAYLPNIQQQLVNLGEVFNRIQEVDDSIGHELLKGARDALIAALANVETRRRAAKVIE